MLANPFGKTCTIVCILSYKITGCYYYVLWFVLVNLLNKNFFAFIFKIISNFNADTKKVHKQNTKYKVLRCVTLRWSHWYGVRFTLSPNFGSRVCAFVMCVYDFFSLTHYDATTTICQSGSGIACDRQANYSTPSLFSLRQWNTSRIRRYFIVESHANAATSNWYA